MGVGREVSPAPPQPLPAGVRATLPLFPHRLPLLSPPDLTLGRGWIIISGTVTILKIATRGEKVSSAPRALKAGPETCAGGPLRFPASLMPTPKGKRCSMTSGGSCGQQLGRKCQEKLAKMKDFHLP